MTSPELNLLGRSRSEFSKAKAEKAVQWRWEICASVLAIFSSFVPVAVAAAIGVALGCACKILAKWAQVSSRAAFRAAERARRLSFQERALGWRVRPEQYGDLLFSFTPSTRALEAEAAAKLEDGYFTNQGPPGAVRMLTNLRESIFWSERLSASMATRRGWQCVLALVTIVLALVVVALVGSAQVGLIAVRLVALFVLLNVSLDLLFEYRGFRRSEGELRQLGAAAGEQARKGPPSLEAALSIMVEYDCSMQERPLVPDAIHLRHEAELDAAWRRQCAAEVQGSGDEERLAIARPHGG
jgi:hypothetical protein